MPVIHKIQLRNGFSDRNKIEPINKQIQVTNFNERTRTAIANLFHDWIFNYKNESIRCDFFQSIIGSVFVEFLSSKKLNDIYYSPEIVFGSYILDNVMNSTYHEVLTLVEYITLYYVNNEPQHFGELSDFNYKKDVNKLFELECVGYRFVGDCIVAITDKEEIESIVDALGYKFDGCKSHISKALGFLANRDKPDYKNSIKESISAVESICQIITGNSKSTLGEAIDLLDKNGIHIHKALQDAFKKLYGYTSDQGGIRHSEGMFESDVTFDDAKYMLVSCCAFVNYLVPKYDSIKKN